MQCQSTDTCASCRKFALSLESGGVAQCPEFGRKATWNDRACVLHMPARDREQRKRIVVQLMKEINSAKA